MGKGLASIVMGGFLSLLGGYYAGRASAEEVNVEKQTISSPSSSSASSCQEEFSKALQTKVRDYAPFCTQLGMNEEATRTCSSLLERFRGKMQRSYPEVKGLDHNPLWDYQRGERGKYLCNNIKVEKYKSDCNSFFSQVEPAFLHDCEFKEAQEHLTEEMNPKTFCSYFSTEQRRSQCESDFQSGIENHCSHLSPPLQKQYQDEIIDKFFSQGRPSPAEKELRELSVGQCRDDLALQPATALLTLKTSSALLLYGENLSPLVISLEQRSFQEEKDRMRHCDRRIMTATIEELCKETEGLCPTLLTRGWLQRSDRAKTLQEHCSDFGERVRQQTLGNLHRGRGKREAGFSSDKEYAQYKAGEVERECYEQFVEAKDICLLTLPAIVPIGEAENIKNNPRILNRLEVTQKSFNSSTVSCEFPIFVFSKTGEIPSLHFDSNDFSSLEVKLQYTPQDRVTDSFEYEVRASGDDWQSNKITTYQLTVRAGNNHGASISEHLKVAFDGRGKVNPRELIQSLNTAEWRMTEAGYSHGLRTETLLTPFPGREVLSALRLAGHAAGGFWRPIKEYKVKGEQPQEWYGEVMVGAGIGINRGFRRYPFLLEGGLGYNGRTSLHPARLAYLAIRGNELWQRDLEYALLGKMYTQKPSGEIWASVEARAALQFSPRREGWGAVVAGKITHFGGPRAAEIAAGIRYRQAPAGSWLQHLDLELVSIVEHRTDFPLWRARLPLEEKGVGYAAGGAFRINFEL